MRGLGRWGASSPPVSSELSLPSFLENFQDAGFLFLSHTLNFSSDTKPRVGNGETLNACPRPVAGMRGRGAGSHAGTRLGSRTWLSPRWQASRRASQAECTQPAKSSELNCAQFACEISLTIKMFASTLKIVYASPAHRPPRVSGKGPASLSGASQW